jgi:LPXTG-motif cell wall-anchored protein
MLALLTMILKYRNPADALITGAIGGLIMMLIAGIAGRRKRRKKRWEDIDKDDYN